MYVDNAVDEVSLVKINQDNDFNIYNLIKVNSITLNTQAVNDNLVITNSYVDQFNQERVRSRRDLGVDFYIESNGLVKKNQDNDPNDENLTNLDSTTVIRNPSLDKELAIKNDFDESLGRDKFLRFIQTLENYIKVYL